VEVLLLIVITAQEIKLFSVHQPAVAAQAPAVTLIMVRAALLHQDIAIWMLTAHALYPLTV